MGAILNRIEDPRDNLERATRDEVWDFAKANGVHFDQLTTPKVLMEKELRARGLVNIPIVTRVMGRPVDVPVVHESSSQPEIREVDAIDDLARQLRDSAKMAPRQPDRMTMGQLRKELKARGIKFDRKDKMETLKTRLAECDYA